jgi:hypothetical protein
MKHILSKSTFMYGLQCPKRLFLHKFRADLYPVVEDAQQQAVFDAGITAGELAQELFPNGIDAKPATPYEYQNSVKKTQQYLMTNDVIYEACFQFEGALCAIDILVRKEDLWYAFEVKGTNGVKPQHITDAAFQYYVMTKCGLPIGDISIVHFNRDYVRKGRLDIEALFASESIMDQVIAQQNFIESNISSLMQMVLTKQEPVIAVGAQCDKPFVCPFKAYCWEGKEEEKNADLSTEPIINKIPLRNYLNKLEYPLFYFDFETVMYGIPKYDESSPWQALPFQYSLHKQVALHSDWLHSEYLGDGITDPREALIVQMMADLGTEGTILAWHAIYEIGCLRGLAKNFPQYQQQIEAIIERVVDLKIPFSQKWIDIPACEGSASIKKVLPIFIPELSYQDLEIQEGMYASFVYSQLAQQDKATQEIQRYQLLQYCKLDTFAMVKILEKIYLLMDTA